MPEDFNALRQELLSCRDCQARFGFEPHPVVRGRADAKIMQISQAPSGRVHETRLPFDDASGKKLKGEWYRVSDEVFYDEANFYLTSCGHCYPGKAPGGGDRLPPAACAKKWLRREAEAVNCRLYICIGSRAAGFFFPGEDFSGLVFGENTINGKPALVLPHPSPLNIKWFQDHPRFLAERVGEVGALVRRTLGLE